jgi:hypothetical protein
MTVLAMEAVSRELVNVPQALVGMIAQSTCAPFTPTGALVMDNAEKMDVYATMASGGTTAPARQLTVQIIAPATVSVRIRSAHATPDSPVQTAVKLIPPFLARRTALATASVTQVDPHHVFACHRGLVTSVTLRSTVAHKTSTTARDTAFAARPRKTIRRVTGLVRARLASVDLRATASALPAPTTVLATESVSDRSAFATQDSPAATAPS